MSLSSIAAGCYSARKIRQNRSSEERRRCQIKFVLQDWRDGSLHGKLVITRNEPAAFIRNIIFTDDEITELFRYDLCCVCSELSGWGAAVIQEWGWMAMPGWSMRLSCAIRWVQTYEINQDTWQKSVMCGGKRSTEILCQQEEIELHRGPNVI